MDTKKVDPRFPSLPFHLDRLGSKPWRHPVFGNRNVWTIQYGQEVFYKTLSRYDAKFRKAVLDAMDEIAKEIES